MFLRYFFSSLVLILFAFVFTSCGGSGSDGNFSGAGQGFISASPSNIDVGDRTLITVEISDVNEDGIVIKVRFPDALSYVGDTASLRVDGDDIDIVPDVNAAGDNDTVFLVFFLAESDFDSNGSGTVTFELQANDSVNNGEVEVDVDVDDPTTDNSVEFDPEEPRFQEEDADTIEVEK